MGQSEPAESVFLEEAGGDEAVEYRSTSLSIEIPQAHCLLERQSHAGHLTEFTADSSQQGILPAGTEEHHRARFTRAACCWVYSAHRPPPSVPRVSRAERIPEHGNDDVRFGVTDHQVMID